IPGEPIRRRFDRRNGIADLGDTRLFYSRNDISNLSRQNIFAGDFIRMKMPNLNRAEIFFPGNQSEIPSPRRRSAEYSDEQNYAGVICVLKIKNQGLQTFL